MIEAGDLVGGIVGAGLGWYVGAKRSFKRLPPWPDMRLMRFAGERPDHYVEVRDIGRSSVPARLWFGRDFRYVVQHYRGAELIENMRYRNPHDALERFEQIKTSGLAR